MVSISPLVWPNVVTSPWRSEEMYRRRCSSSAAATRLCSQSEKLGHLRKSRYRLCLTLAPVGKERERMASGVPCALSDARKSTVLKGRILGTSEGDERSNDAGTSDATYRLSGERNRSVKSAK